MGQGKDGSSNVRSSVHFTQSYSSSALHSIMEQGTLSPLLVMNERFLTLFYIRWSCRNFDQTYRGAPHADDRRSLNRHRAAA